MYKKLINNLIFTILTLLLILAGVNFFIDPFSIFCDTTDYAVKNKKVFPNERYLKVKFIINNNDKYDSFLFGSCACNDMNLSSYGKWYNLVWANNNLYDTKRTLEYLTNKVYGKGQIKRIIIQLADENLKEDSQASACQRCKDNIQYCHFPLTLYEKIFFYGRYLFYFPAKYNNLDLFEKWIYGAKKNIFKSGSFVDRLPENKEEVDVPTDFDSFYNLQVNKINYKDENLYYIKEIIQLCKDNDIEYDFFIVPEYYEYYNLINQQAAFDNFKRKFVKLTPFYDFTGSSIITEDKSSFRDAHHLKPYTVKLISDRLFKEDKNNPPKIKGFGDYITENNIEQILSNK